ncbi:hypothetical protein INS49_000983 [Diaporthe citri]|uniref:uncharacterized protein n=1 Tax=Diaporthe citri TaxID=83186 RepID=UPI001C7F1B40|nr:uncharacterized protein INS49_000983 [Diaporthe citri]KAG6366803.1 hypothetical protein INS49_000983 [Diaporthe citri]
MARVCLQRAVQQGLPLLYVMCKDWCEFVIVDAPVEHPAYNYGCVDPVGGTVLGNYGSVSRDTDLPPGDDGFVMEAFEGPPRKD